MRLDVDVVREILVNLEDAPVPVAGLTGQISEALEMVVPGHSAEELSAHVRLLEEGGYLQAVQRRRGDQLQWFPTRLTWTGYQMLESMKSKQAFEQAKRAAARALGQVTLEAVRIALSSIRDEMLQRLR